MRNTRKKIWPRYSGSRGVSRLAVHLCFCSLIDALNGDVDDGAALSRHYYAAGEALHDFSLICFADIEAPFYWHLI